MHLQWKVHSSLLRLTDNSYRNLAQGLFFYSTYYSYFSPLHSPLLHYNTSPSSTTTSFSLNTILDCIITRSREHGPSIDCFSAGRAVRHLSIFFLAATAPLHIHTLVNFNQQQSNLVLSILSFFDRTFALRPGSSRPLRFDICFSTPLCCAFTRLSRSQH